MSLKDSAPRVYAKLLKNYKSFVTLPSEKSLVHEGIAGIFSQKSTPMNAGKGLKDRNMRRFKHFERMDQIQIKTQQIVEKLNPNQSK